MPEMLIGALARLAGESAQVSLLSQRHWASITFSGVRYKFAVDCAEERATAFATAVPEAELPLRRHFVADALVVSTQAEGAMTRVIVELLVLPDA
ncbi:MAG: hypothetical protein U5J78_00570 [Parasphingorhabdus sp.]|nr:hypothetical protein [Parasphingorhabdus sp.]